MKGTYFLGNGKFETKELPSHELSENEVLIKVAACGICGTDVHIYHGDKGSASVTPPVILGHELSGIVEKIGSAVKNVSIGDHVTVDPNRYCGKCHYCKIGKKQLCTSLYATGVNENGGFAEYCYVRDEQCFKVSKELPLKYAAMTEPLACCLHGIDRAKIRQGDTVCVIGGGAIGLLMVQLAKLSGASVVILSEPVEMRRKIGLQVGADYAINPKSCNLPDEIEKILGIDGVDVVIECIGNLIATSQAFAASKRGTTVLLFSVPKAGAKYELDMGEVYQKELNIIGSMINPDTHERACRLISTGKINLEHIITHSFPVDKVEDAIKMQMSDESIKVIVEP